MPEIINWELARNPLNWIVLFLMVVIAYMGAQYVAMSFTSPSAMNR